MTAPASQPEPEQVPITPRRRERRAAIGEVVASLARALSDCPDVASLRGCFEDIVRRVVPVRSVHLLEATPRWTAARRHSGQEGDSVAVEVPGPKGGGVLQALCDVGRPLCEWELQALGMAADVGALVLEIEYCRRRLARAGVLPGPKAKRDGAAPLIGSTPVMRTLRSRIERVANTDFTVLLEGESGVGKELVARQIHELSRRRSGPFVAINCAALVETLL